MSDISAAGLSIFLQASFTFPQGFSITEFSDDTDPFDTDNLIIGEQAMGLNGNQVFWQRANPLRVTLSVVAYSDNDTNLAILFDANRIGTGKTTVNDIITMTATYPNSPDRPTVIYTEGIIMEGSPVGSVASTQRIKSKTYVFGFGNKTGY